MVKHDLDFEERRKRQRIRVFVTEILMFFAVIAIVVVATLISMGFFVSSDGSIEQAGLLQVHSLPTGATVEIDGETIFPRTNLSRTLAVGKHTVKLSRDGYDSWSKTVKMYPGVLLRVYYPRLFLQNRIPEAVKSLGEELGFYSVAQNRNNILYSAKDATIWNLVDISGDEIKTTKLDMSEILPEVEADKFLGSVESLEWSNDGRRVLVKLQMNDAEEWILVDLKDLKSSLNLTETFGMEFEQVKIIDGSADQLLVFEKHHLRKINTSAQALSRVLLDNIAIFAHQEADVIYVTMPNSKNERQIGVYRDGEKAGTTLKTVKTSENVQVALSEFYGNKYMIYTIDNKLSILYGDLPMYNAEEPDLSKVKALLEDMELSFAPNAVNVSGAGEYIVFARGSEYAVVDIDTGDVFSYQAIAQDTKWLDDSMLYTVKDLDLIVWDFDGTNQRTLTKADDYDVVLTANNRWLYYLYKNDKGELELTRERVMN